MKILLFAITGFGNKALDVLLKENEVKYLFTRKEDGDYPYFKCENISSYAKGKGVEVFEDYNWDDVRRIIKEYKPAIAIISTFHKIIPEDILKSIDFINFHPSLLPKHKGKTPIDYALEAGDKKTGVTAHYMTKKIDSGEIILQKEIKIDKDDIKNSLMEKLSVLSAEVLDDVMQNPYINF